MVLTVARMLKTATAVNISTRLMPDRPRREAAEVEMFMEFE